MKHKSQWFEGLKTAERMGYLEAKSYLHELDCGHDDIEFINGFIDYIHYYQDVIQPRLIDGQVPS